MGKAPSPKIGILKKAKLSLGKDKKKNQKSLGKDEKSLAKDMLLGKSTKPLAKGKAKAKAKAQQLIKKSLEKLGSMNFKEKIQSAAEQGSDPEEAAAILKNSLSAAENDKVWSKHQTFLKHNPWKRDSLRPWTRSPRAWLQPCGWCCRTPQPGGTSALHRV